MASAKEIRRHFVAYFERNDHEALASSPLVPRNDPSLLFTSAGMVQFKNIFTGLETPPVPRAVTVQKCLRAGGKHNDLENVGYTARHHTFFEMLGNFSFRDYFKETAIPLAWELIVKEWDIDPKRLLITVHDTDQEARKIWRKVTGFPDEKIIPIAGDDNFWAMGNTGPCGPCSEIFYDYGPEVEGGPPGSDQAEGDRFVEIWNLVFMQYERGDFGQRDLTKPSVDTGMGLERISALLQGEHDNFASDLFAPILHAVAERTGMEPNGPNGVSHRVIADHLRAAAFLIADNVLPSNEGRGYVLRRILRRAMRHVRLLEHKEPLLHALVPILIAEMGEAYPELRRAQALTTTTLRSEEERFGDTLSRGMKILEEEIARLPKNAALGGAAAFRLYDTYGFPLDLTQDILRATGHSVDVRGFEKAMQAQRETGRCAWSGAGAGGESQKEPWQALAEKHGNGEFLGYTTESAEGLVRALVRAGKVVESVAENEEAEMICNQTPFYAESGGQEGDHGIASGADGLRLDVLDVQKRGELHVHRVRVTAGTLVTGAELRLSVDRARRARLRAHHSATHLLHEALRRILGSHVTQKGSLVAEDRMRFDFSHPEPLSAEELRAVSDEVNANILGNAPVETRLMPPDEAIEKNGALALFGEKYATEVRVVSMGNEDQERPSGRFSTELCGGTHVTRVGEIGLFHLLSEESLAAGVRRITATAGRATADYLQRTEKLLGDVSRNLRAPLADLPERTEVLMRDLRALRQEVTKLRSALATGGGASNPEFKRVGTVRFATRTLQDVPPRELRGMTDRLKGQLGSGVAALITVMDGRASLVVGVTMDLTERISAVDLARCGAAALGGTGGGGRPDFAQAGGPDAKAAQKALAAIESALAKTAVSA